MALVVVAVALTLLGAKSTGMIGGPETVDAALANAGGSLAEGADVKLNGIIVGRVNSIAAGEDGRVRAELGLKTGQLGKIPNNVVARVLPATVFGTSYVDLTTHGPYAEEPLQKHALIPQDEQQETLEVQQALDDIDGLIDTLRPAQLSATLGAVATALDGRGAQLGTTIDTLESYLAKVQPKVPLIRSDIRKLAENLEIIQQVAPDALDATADSLVTMKTVRDQSANLNRILTRGAALLGRSNTFLKEIRPMLVPFLRDASIVLDVFHDLRKQAFSESFAQLRLVSAKILSTIRFNWVDNDVHMITDAPDYYGPVDCPRYGNAAGDNCGGR
ncbi:MAG: MCE family protein [Myxococcales bacterium]|nr:MAG: MCE family protein [Myxococcales bacterium]